MVTPPYSSRSSPFLQPLQALVGVLPGNAGERSDFFLGDLQMRSRGRVENRVEQRGDASGRARAVASQRAVILQSPR